MNGVKSTLQRRIDPDGTRELNIYSSDFDGENIFCGTHVDIDTPETREKLLKRIDLEFKEPNTEGSDQEKPILKPSQKKRSKKSRSRNLFISTRNRIYSGRRRNILYQVSLREDQKNLKTNFPRVFRKKWGKPTRSFQNFSHRRKLHY